MDVADGYDSVAEFDRFYGEIADAVLRQMVLLTGDVAEAQDVTQEAFERAWLHWSTVRNHESPEAWVRTVARRLAVSRWRRARNASTAWLRRETPSSPSEISSDHVALMAALTALPTAQRVAIVLHHLADLPVSQVAAETGATESTVRQRLVRGRAALAVLMADDGAAGGRQPERLLRREER